MSRHFMTVLYNLCPPLRVTRTCPIPSLSQIGKFTFTNWLFCLLFPFSSFPRNLFGERSPDFRKLISFAITPIKLPLKCSHIILRIFHKCITNGAHDQTLLLKGLYKGATAIGTDTAPEEYTGYPRGGSAAWMVRFLRSVG